MRLCYVECFRNLPGALVLGFAGVRHLCIIHAIVNTCALIARVVAYMVVAFMVERSSWVTQPKQFIYCWGGYM